MMSKQKSIWKKTAIRQAFQRLMFGEDGAVLVEATLIAPILVVMSVYVTDFGLSFYYKMEMQNAAQAVNGPLRMASIILRLSRSRRKTPHDFRRPGPAPVPPPRPPA